MAVVNEQTNKIEKRIFPHIMQKKFQKKKNEEKKKQKEALHILHLYSIKCFKDKFKPGNGKSNKSDHCQKKKTRMRKRKAAM